MAASAFVANCILDVTIFLVEKSSMEDSAGSTSNKRRRTSVDPSEVAHGKQVGKVKVKASRLRQCSTYFDTCMSERWAQSKVPSEMKFHLEVHTEVRYYEDCFSRMQFLFKPINGVACCIELLKVASQIGFQGVIDMGVKYLAAALWSDEEEKLVHEFRDSHLVPLDSLTELIARLDDFPAFGGGKLNKNSLFVRNLLSDYLQCAFPGLIEGSSRAVAGKGYCYSCHLKFECAFYLVVTGTEPGVCACVVKHSLKLLKKASLALLSSLKEAFDSVNSPENRRSNPWKILSVLCRLYKMARKANAAQTMVELILGDDQVSNILHDAHLNEEDGYLHESVWKWARMIYSIVQDVLEGTLFLDTSQRVALFNQWHWVLCDIILEVDEVDVAGLTARFLSTLPRQEQAEIWKALKFHCDHGPSLEAHAMWFSYMISGNATVRVRRSGRSAGARANLARRTIRP